jgi:hypothetical protein
MKMRVCFLLTYIYSSVFISNLKYYRERKKHSLIIITEIRVLKTRRLDQFLYSAFIFGFKV